MAVSDTERLIGKINDLIKSLEGETPEDRKKRHKDEGKQRAKKISKERDDAEEKKLKEQREKILEETEKYNKTELELLEKKYNEQLELLKKAGEDTTALTEKYERERAEIIEKEFKKGLGDFRSGFRSLKNLVKDVEKDISESYGKADQEAVNYARAIGMGRKELESYKDNLFDYIADNDFGKLYNASTDEMIKLMGSYNKELGRANRLTNEQLENMAQLNLLMGDTAAIKFTTNLDKFGIDVSGAKEMYEGMLNEASSKGIVLTDLSENFLSNIELAQQYTFEDGVEGLKRMAEQATALKWDMKQTAAFAEKVNSIEGAVKTGAQLSVLGGPFAQFSNPMGMLYESLNDMEGLQNRMMTMFKNLGTWNSETGQLEVSAFNRMRIRGAAEAMGLNYGDVMKNIFSQARREKVLSSIKGMGLDEKTEELVANTAQLDKNGQAYVTINGEKRYVKDGLKDEDRKYLEAQANDQSKDVKDIAITTKSMLEHQQGVQKERANELTKFIQDIGGGTKLNNLYDVLADMQKYILIIEGSVLAIKGIIAMAKMGSALNTMLANRGAVTNAAGNIMTNARGALSLRNIKPSAASMGIGAGVGIVGGLASMAMSSQADRLAARDNFDDAAKVSRGASALGWAATGAGIGSAFGLPGMLIGAALGGIGGYIFGGNDYAAEKAAKKEAEERKKQLEYIRSRGYAISDNYTSAELLEIRKGYNGMSSGLISKLEQNDPGLVRILPLSQFSSGGLINGPSHSNGGVAVNGTNIEVEGGEFVVNKESTRNNLPLIKAINDNTITPLQPMGEILTVKESSSNVYDNHHQVKFDTLQSNVGGEITLRLDGNSKNIDARELISNPSFIAAIRDRLIIEMNMTNDKSFKKDKYYRKF